MDVIEYEFFDNGTVKVKKIHVEKKVAGFRKKREERNNPTNIRPQKE
ncbi:hypothetical protein [Hydrogenimonas sp.]